MKKVFCAALAFLLLLVSCSAPAAESGAQKEAEPVTSGAYTYVVLDDGTAEILSYTGEEAELSIPADIDGIPVSSIGEKAFYSNDAIGSLVIPDGVTTIGSNAFCGCHNISSVSLPDTLRKISMYAFSVLPELTHITIPESVEEIGISAFGSCKSLYSVTFLGDPGVIGGNPFSECEMLSVIDLPEDGALSVVQSALIDTRDNRFIAYLVGYGVAPGAQKQDIFYSVPDGIEIIGAQAFRRCRELSEVVLPDGVTAIEGEAFSFCGKLARVRIPDSVAEIDGRGGLASFDGCDALTAVVGHGSYAESYCLEQEIAVEYES